MTTATTEQIKKGNYQDIVKQIGGNKFLTMTGSKIKYYGFDELGYVYIMIELVKNQSGEKYLKIQLNGIDLYNMEFSKIKKTQLSEYKALGLKIYDEQQVIIETIENVYAEDLQEIFTDRTGLLTRLF